MADADWDLVYEMNLRYVVRAVRAAVRHFLGHGGGTVVSVGSVTGVMAAPRQAGYGAAKAGLGSLAKTVAAEYSGDGIRMNVIAAGPVSTPVSAAVQDPQGVAEIPIGRYGLPDDIAQAAVFLASDQSSYLTGQSIVVDGGSACGDRSPRRRDCGTAVGGYTVQRSEGGPERDLPSVSANCVSVHEGRRTR